MRRNLIVLAMTLGFCFLLSAQVGINTTDPKVTFQIVGSPDTATVQDGILIPRLTRTQLADKDDVYTTDQNGTMVFVTDVTGTSTTKTTNVTGIGMYYYNGTTSKWVSLSTKQELNVTNVDNSNYTATAADDIILFLGNKTMALTLPTSTDAAPIPIGKKIYISCSGNSSALVELNVRETSILNVYSGSSATLVYTGDTSINTYDSSQTLGPWSNMSGY